MTDVCPIRFRRGYFRRALLPGVLLLISILGVAQSGSEHRGIGFAASKDVTSKDVGLPVYPGAKISEKDSEGDSSGQLGIWGGSTQLRLVFLKLTSADSPGKISSFYRNALGRYGKVLDCTGVTGPGKKDSKSNELTCDDEHDLSGTLLKAGTRQNQHMVGIEQKDGKTVIQLVYLVAEGEDNKI